MNYMQSMSRLKDVREAEEDKVHLIAVVAATAADLGQGRLLQAEAVQQSVPLAASSALPQVPCHTHLRLITTEIPLKMKLMTLPKKKSTVEEWVAIEEDRVRSHHDRDKGLDLEAERAVDPSQVPQQSVKFRMMREQSMLILCVPNRESEHLPSQGLRPVPCPGSEANLVPARPHACETRSFPNVRTRELAVLGQAHHLAQNHDIVELNGVRIRNLACAPSPGFVKNLHHVVRNLVVVILLRSDAGRLLRERSHAIVSTTGC